MNRNSPNHAIGRNNGWPLQLVVFGNFQPRDDGARSPLQETNAYAVDKDSFDEVLSKVVGNLSLRIRQSDTLLFEKEWIHLPLRSIRSFRPEGVADGVPELHELLDTRKRMADFADGKLSIKELRSHLSGIQKGERILERVQAAPSAQKPKSRRTVRYGLVSSENTKAAKADDIVESILGIVDLPVANQSKSAALPTTPEIKSLIPEIGKTSAAAESEKAGEARVILGELNAMICAGVDRILHHPEFRRLEALWRGLKLLVDRTDFREPIRIEIRSCTMENLVDSFAIFADQVESRGGLEADTVVLAAYEFNRSSRDMEILRRLSEMAEDLQTLLISSVGLEFFGFESAGEFERVSCLGAIFDQTEYVKWRALREAESSRWLTLLFNRFLLRYPYAPEQVRIRGFDYSETPSTSPDGTYLWGNPVWGIGSLLTRRFAASGDCVDIAGWKNGLIEDLPIREVRLENGDAFQSGIEVNICEDKLADLVREGIAALFSKINTDSAALLSAPTTHLPDRYGNEKETKESCLRVLLPYQLFVSRIAVCARRLAGAISPGLAPDTVGALIKEILLEFVPGRRNTEAVEVEISESEQYPKYYDVNLMLLPDRVGWDLPPVQMQLRVGR